jgi:nucleoside-diphosphate-sugar epimerase
LAITGSKEWTMRVLVAGATGALGVPLVRRLVAGGHTVLGLTRRAEAVPQLQALGASAVVADALDREALLRAVDPLGADAVVHELTALATPPMRHSGMAATNRLRTEGSRNLLAAAKVLGAKRFVTQSIIFGYGYRDHGDHVLVESDPFGEPEGTACDPHLAAMRAAEQLAFEAPEGIALRYGMLYGGDLAAMRPLLVKRRLPTPPGGVLGWVHHEDAAAATVAALEHGRPGEAYNIVDDLPATWADVFTAMADAVGAPAPRRLPAWLFRLVAPYPATFAVDTTLRTSNAKAKRELGWTPEFPDFRAGLAVRGAVGR